MAVLDVAEPAGSGWDEELWDELLDYIEAGIVVPIIGPASYPVEIDGRIIALDRYVAECLADKLSLPLGEGDAEPTLNDIVSAHVAAGGRRERLYSPIHKLVQDALLAPPLVLKRLAEIRHFNLFVTTGFDSLLETAINEARFDGEARTQTIAYALNKKEQDDLPPGGTAGGRPIVYHLFGKASPMPNSYAISDEDLIEFLHALQSENRPENLLHRLENENLLLIGGNFPDWVARFFLRTMKRKRLSDSPAVLECLAENHLAREPGLVAYLAHFSRKTQIFHGTAEFVETLWQRWSARQGDPADPVRTLWRPPPADMPEDAVFISYAREDAAAVRTLKDALEAAGLSVWFDLDRLGPGDTFDQKIEDNIRRCRLFMPVLSRTTQTRREGFFRREWNCALDRDRNIDTSHRFIIPVAIDEGLDVNSLPKRYREINLTPAPRGRLSSGFIEQLKPAGPGP